MRTILPNGLVAAILGAAVMLPARADRGAAAEPTLPPQGAPARVLNSDPDAADASGDRAGTARTRPAGKTLSSARAARPRSATPPPAPDPTRVAPALVIPELRVPIPAPTGTPATPRGGNVTPAPASRPRPPAE